MSAKEFFRPTKKRLILPIVALLFFFFLALVNNVDSFREWGSSVSPLLMIVFMPLFIAFFMIPTGLLNIMFSFVGRTWFKNNFACYTGCNPTTAIGYVVVILFQFVLFYLLSCVLAWIFGKFRRKNMNSETD